MKQHLPHWCVLYSTVWNNQVLSLVHTEKHKGNTGTRKQLRVLGIIHNPHLSPILATLESKQEGQVV